jgi:hypothetical protein
MGSCLRSGCVLFLWGPAIRFVGYSSFSAIRVSMSREAGVTERRVGGEGDCLLSKLYGWGQGVGVGGAEAGDA